MLIHRTRILGTFESQRDAIDQGYRAVGLVPFLVKHVVEVETPVQFTSNVIAV